MLRPSHRRVRSAGPAPGDATRPDPRIRALVEEHAEAAYRVAYSILRDPGLAEDVVQETMLRAWEALPRYRGEGSMRSWVLSIAHNTAISMLRRRREVAVADEDLPEGGVHDETARRAQGRADLAALRVALDRLDGLSRSVVVLADLEGLPYEEIARTLDVPLPTVKTRLMRARRALQSALEEGGSHAPRG